MGRALSLEPFTDTWRAVVSYTTLLRETGLGRCRNSSEKEAIEADVRRIYGSDCQYGVV